MTLPKPSPSLAHDQRDVFRRLRNKVSHPRVADAEYDKLKAARNGKLISADLARFLAPEFASWDGRIRHTLSTGALAGWYAHQRLLRSLRTYPPGKLLITAGGAGSGKTTAVLGMSSGFDLVFDNQLRDFGRAIQLIREARRADWSVVVLLVYRPFEDAVRAVIRRSWETGRWNRLGELSRMHRDSCATVLRLKQECRSDDGVSFHALYNGSAAGVRDSEVGLFDFSVLNEKVVNNVQWDDANEKVIKEVVQESKDKGIYSEDFLALLA